MPFNYIEIIGERFPDTQAELPVGADPTVYGDIVWRDTPIPQLTLETEEANVEDNNVSDAQIKGANVAQTGQTVQWDGEAFVFVDADGGNTMTDLPLIQVRRETSMNNIGTGWNDVYWEHTDFQNNTDYLELSGGDARHIIMQAVGHYLFEYKTTGYTSVGGRMMLNTSTYVVGSETDPVGLTGQSGLDSTRTEGIATAQVIVQCTAPGQTITFQVRSNNVSGDNTDKISMNAVALVALQGAKGDTGAAGQDGAAGATVEVSDEGVALPSVDYGKFNFVGTGVTVTETGGDTAQVSIDAGGIDGLVLKQNDTTVTGGPFTTLNFHHPTMLIEDQGNGEAILHTRRVNISDRHNGTVTQTFGGTRITLLFDSAVREDSFYTYSNGEYTILQAGWYSMHSNVAYDQNAVNSRSSVESELQYDTGGAGSWVVVPGSVNYGYSRQTSIGFGTLITHALEFFNVGDKVRVQAYRNAGAGSIDTVIEGSRFTLRYEEES